MPALQIAQFSGNLVDWPEFKACCEGTFTRIMDETNRFRYLKSNLSGEPGRMVKHLPLNASSYNKAWAMLNKRYDNQRAIINANLKRLFDLPMLKTESGEDLKNMLNTTNECIAAINSYKISTNSWDAIMIFLISQRLDANNIKHWEERIQASKTIPKLSEMLDFLEIRINILETTASVQTYAKASGEYVHKKQKIMLNTDIVRKCTICKANHFAYTCQMLNAKPDEDKIAFIKEKGLCVNCLHNHSVDECTSKFSCKICGERHNSVLHTAAAVFSIITDTGDIDIDANCSEIEQEELQAREMAFTTQMENEPNSGQVILATAVIKIEYNNRSFCVRALIDQGSTTNLITRGACKALNLLEKRVNIPITGIGGHVSCRVTKRTNFKLRSLVNDQFSMDIPALIVPRITTLRPLRIKNEWIHLRELTLADQISTTTNRIEVLLGASTFAQIILQGLVKGATGQPIAQKTELGWIISGRVHDEMFRPMVPVFTITVSDETLSNSLQKFWETEEIPRNRLYTPEEKLAEKIYSETTIRCPDGRYMVRLPFKANQPPELGNLFSIAQKRFKSMIKRFHDKPDLRLKYDQCIQEYLDLNHMEPIDKPVESRYYMPHHPVFKEASTTTKIRPVFDASCKNINGSSLNSELLIGPTIQPDLFSLIIIWRKNEYVITGDIEKMYRQVWIHPDDANYQCILWNPKESCTELQSYRLKTVTFGVASAPFLAIRTLFQIGMDIKNHLPIIAEKIQNRFYVDDYFDSLESIEEAKNTIQQISIILADYGFSLRKWKSNHPAILQNLCEDEKDSSPCNIFKTLGIQWQPDSDEFVFMPTQLSEKSEWNKRTILSEICRVFDPLGWLSPCVILAKIFMQKLWLLQLDWDEIVPNEITREWETIRRQFTTTCSVKIPRWIGMSSDVRDVSLQGFADASEKAFACVIYVRILYADNTISCKLIAAKTRVAPLKKMTIPRLELNAAVLLSSLMDKTKEALKIPALRQQAWTDSMIVLYWLADHPSRWKSYVAQRVSEIQNTLPSRLWRHIDSTHNPADCASRGLNITELEKFTMWWVGPQFLVKSENEWPERRINISPKQNLEEKQTIQIHHVFNEEVQPIITRFSDYNKMLRVLTICLRWRNKTRSKLHNENLISTPITTNELLETETRIIRLVQVEAFSAEIYPLKNKKQIPTKSTLQNLDPYLDDMGILRVGGRIQHSSLSETEKHQIIMPQKHHFTKLLISHAHKQTLHGGTALTIQNLRQKYWIISCRKAVSSTIYKCIICFRLKKKLLTQKMGNLPAYRLQEAIPFTYTGVDYAGYFEVKSSQRKNAPYVKAYVALFICLTTRAVHLELVSDLSSTQFMKALKRFIGRRGIPARMFSDNALNFIGADREIRENLEQMLKQNDSEITEILLKNRIIWETIPARAPHFGGWESGVKLFKHHLKRVLGNIRICFEDFNTLIIEIEAVINSRPLWSIPTRPDEYDALTPGHFLVFKPLLTLPEPSTSEIQINRLSQYQYLQRLLSDFWKVWSTEYIQSLQTRKKWHETKPNVHIGQIVLVSEDNEIPAQWSLGRITNIFHGSDGLVRVADVYCRSKTLRRPIHKLSLLPIIDNEQPGERVID